MKQILVKYKNSDILVKLTEEGYLDHNSQHVLETIFPGSTSRPGGYLPGIVLPWIEKHFEVQINTDTQE